MKVNYEINGANIEIRQMNDYALVRATAKDYDIRDKFGDIEVVKRFRNCIKDIEKPFYNNPDVSTMIENLFTSIIARSTWDKPTQDHHQWMDDNVVVDIHIDNQTLSVSIFRY